jgi:hypothetical protein
MHDIAGVGITVATILAATFFSNQSVNSLRTGLRSEMNSLRLELIGRLESIQKHIREFYAEQARHDVRITNLEQQHKN